MSRNTFKGNARGRGSSVSDGFSTRQVASLARVRIGRILSALRTTGNWRGVEPISRKPLVWPRREIRRVLCQAPDRELMTHGERVLCNLMDMHGVDLDRGWPLVPLLLAKPDLGRDPTLAFDDVDVLVIITMAVTDRLDVSWPMLDDPGKERGLRYLSFLMSLLDGFTPMKKQPGNNNEN